jgi:hypothetical protein
METHSWLRRTILLATSEEKRRVALEMQKLSKKYYADAEKMQQKLDKIMKED